MLKKYGHGDRVQEFNRLAAEHARSQAPPGHFVVGSVGPTGEFLEPLGEVSEAEMRDAFTEQIVALEKGGADAVVIETKTALEEVSLAIRTAKQNTGLAVIATMVFDKGPRGFFTMMGVTPEQGMKSMLDAGADVVGANCGNGIERMVELSRELRAATDGYLLIHSNAGIPAIIDGEIVYAETPDYMARHFEVLANEGINIVGGCCGTGPDHIRALVKAVRG
jgi:5-methyltetrahydrofolate--homocysteine methyltransferase